MCTSRLLRIVPAGVMAVVILAGCVPRPNPLMVSTDLPNARIGEPYSHTFAVSGGVEPYTYALVGLPGGLNFNATTGTIAGTPGVVHTGYTLEVTVTDSGSPVQQAVELVTLRVKPPAVRITTTQLPNGTVGVAYSASLLSEGGLFPLKWSITAGVLPDGLRLNRDLGVIVDTPTAAGNWTFEITVTDSDDPPTSDMQTLSIEISE